MKTKLYCILLCSLMAMSTFAQEEADRWTAGLRLGAVASDMLYTSNDYKIYSHLPHARGTIGFWAERELFAGLAIRPEFSFTGSGVRMRADDIYYGLFVRTFDIRAGILYYIPVDWFVQPYALLSPALNFVIGNHGVYSDGTGKYIDKKMTTAMINPFNFSMLFGGGVRIPIDIDGFDFYINAELGYNIGCVNTFSKAEKEGKIKPLNGIYSGIVGKRLSSTFEFAVTFGLPIGLYWPDSKPAPAPAVETLPQVDPEQTVAQRQEALVQRLQQQQQSNDYTGDLEKYNERLSAKNRVGDGIKMYVTPNVLLSKNQQGEPELNLKLEFAYETIPDSMKFGKEGDDYPPGKYLAEESRACMATLGFIREQLDGELRHFFTPDTRVTIRITGETDGSRIRSRIPYKGEYGEFDHEPMHLNTLNYLMTVNSRIGITQNGQLGFLRTQGVKHYLINNVEALRNTRNDWQIYAVERKEKGSQYRKISVEITIHNAYAKELQQATNAQE